MAGSVYRHDGVTGWERIGPAAPSLDTFGSMFGPDIAGVATLAGAPPAGPRRGLSLAELTDPQRRANAAYKAAMIAEVGFPTQNLVDQLGLDVAFGIAMEHYGRREQQREREARARAKARHDLEQNEALALLHAQARQPCGACRNCRIGLRCSYALP